MTYDHWKTTNPEDRWLGPAPYEQCMHPFGCPDVDWCRGNLVCYWDCQQTEEEVMDIETMRGEVIDHKGSIQILKTIVADLQARVTELEKDRSIKAPVAGVSIEPFPDTE